MELSGKKISLNDVAVVQSQNLFWGGGWGGGGGVGGWVGAGAFLVGLDRTLLGHEGKHWAPIGPTLGESVLPHLHVI